MDARPLIALAATLLLAACAHAPSHNPMATWVPSPNFEARRPNLIVLHATEQQSVEESLDTLRTANSGGPVSSHYLVGADGRIYQLVADLDRAWHARGGHWGTISDVNNASTGIENDNDGEEPFTTPQIAAVIRLLGDLTERLGIPPTAVIAHADMAPTRKRDPGAHFPWKQLHEAGFGIWPEAPLADPPEGFDPWLALRLVGYPLELDPSPGHPAIVRAFHRRFRGIETDVLDEEDLRILHALTQFRLEGSSIPGAD